MRRSGTGAGSGASSARPSGRGAGQGLPGPGQRVGDRRGARRGGTRVGGTLVAVGADGATGPGASCGLGSRTCIVVSASDSAGTAVVPGAAVSGEGVRGVAVTGAAAACVASSAADSCTGPSTTGSAGSSAAGPSGAGAVSSSRGRPFGGRHGGLLRGRPFEGGRGELLCGRILDGGHGLRGRRRVRTRFPERPFGGLDRRFVPGRTGGSALELASATDPGRCSGGADPAWSRAAGTPPAEPRQQRLRQDDDRGDPAPSARAAATRTPWRAAPGSAATRSPRPSPSRPVRVLVRLRVVQAGVELGDPPGGHADALVLYGEHHLAALQQPAGELDLGVRRREGGGVLQEFGDQMAEVVGGEAGDLGVRRQRLDGDPFVPLDLADGGAQHVDQRDRARVPVAVLGAREDQQVLAVAAHDGGQVVELEEGREPLGVLLALLQLLDDAELALDEAEGAQREVDEGVVDGVPQPFELGGQLAVCAWSSARRGEFGGRRAIAGAGQVAAVAVEPVGDVARGPRSLPCRALRTVRPGRTRRCGR